MKNLAICLISVALAACTNEPKDVSVLDLIKNNQKWGRTFVRTCGFVIAGSCRLKVCAEGTPLADVPSCQAISEIHLSTSSLACHPADSLAGGFWAHVDGNFIALEPSDRFDETNRFVIAKANVGPINEMCFIPRAEGELTREVHRDE